MQWGAPWPLTRACMPCHGLAKLGMSDRTPVVCVPMHLLEEVTIVADGDDGSLEVLQCLFKHFLGWNVQVVGWLRDMVVIVNSCIDC